MKTLSMLDFRRNAKQVLEAVRRGERLVLTYRGKPIARLVATADPRRGVSEQRQHVAATIAALRRQRKGVALEGDVRDLIADGRD